MQNQIVTKNTWSEEFDNLKEKIIAEYNSKIDVANQNATDVVLYSELFLKHFLNQDIKQFITQAINQAREEEWNFAKKHFTEKNK